MKYFYILLALFIISCKASKKEYTAQDIIDNCIINSGANKVSNANIAFKFRDKKGRFVENIYDKNLNIIK